jgi:hypothetical protein
MKMIKIKITKKVTTRAMTTLPHKGQVLATSASTVTQTKKRKKKPKERIKRGESWDQEVRLRKQQMTIK